jgi:hypothetical protein
MEQQVITRLNEIIDRGMCSGMGRSQGQVCIEAAIALACGEELTDEPSCVHPVVQAHAIRLNDSGWSSSTARGNGMRAYALQQLGCREIDGVRFAQMVALRTIREVLPIALRAAGLEEHAVNCESATDLTAADAAAAAAAARYAADAAAAARYAAAAARYAADAADADQVLALAAKIATEVLQELMS